MRIGLALSARPESGGAKDFEDSFLTVLLELVKELNFSLEIIEPRPLKPGILASNPFRKLLYRFRNQPEVTSKSVNPENAVDLVVFPAPNRMMTEIRGTPFIATMWDVGHRDLPEYPEFRGREFSSREKLFSENLPRAYRCLVDSDATGEKIARLYGVDSSRICRIGLLMEESSDANSKRRSESSSSSDPFLLYPAAFWPHKNHGFLLDVMEIVVASRPEMRLVLTGATHDKEVFFRSEIRRRRLENNVEILGFVSPERMKSLYQDARLVVFPSALGPTNLPPLRAAAAGTPALVSEVHRFGPETPALIRSIKGFDSNHWASMILDNAWTEGAPEFCSSHSRQRGKDALREVLLSFARTRGRWL